MCPVLRPSLKHSRYSTPVCVALASGCAYNGYGRTYVCAHVYAYICMYIHVSVPTTKYSMCVHTYVQYICTYVSVWCMYVCMYVSIVLYLLADDPVLCKIKRLFNQFGKFVLYLCDIAYRNGLSSPVEAPGLTFSRVLCLCSNGL